MAQFLLVIVGIGADGADSVMQCDERSYMSAMVGCCFTEPVIGYVWCNTHHDWVRCDEAMVCEKCAEAAYAELERKADEEYDEEAASKWYEGWCEVHQCSGYECACASKRREQFEAGFGAQVDADLDAQQLYGEDVDFAQAQMVAECAEASWHRFCCNNH